MNDDIIKQDLLLIGGGHAHVMAMKQLAMSKPAGVRMTLISSSLLTPYSGMLPGLIAGHYDYDAVHIDLARLCRALGVRFIEDTVVSLDLEQRTVYSQKHPPFHYDVLSIDIGSTPDLASIPGAAEYTHAVKPVDQFLNYWSDLVARIQNKAHGQSIEIALVGAGASGVEVALAVQHRLSQLKPELTLRYHLVSATPDILPGHNDKVRKRYQAVLDKRNVRVHRNFRVTRVAAGNLFDESDPASLKTLECDEIIWATSASAPVWPKQTGLACSDKGFIQVNACLQSISHPSVFAAGDIADVLEHERPKAGVFAVRQGKPLAENLLRALSGEQLKPFVPQKKFLSLVSTGDKYAVASRGAWAMAGKWVWRWKDTIDRKFMNRLNTLSMPQSASPVRASPEAKDAMRCGGCGAKVGQPILERVLAQLPVSHKPTIQLVTKLLDDAAVFAVPDDKLLVQSVDSFRKFIEDDFLFGQIAANHALGDIYAMGATPHSAQVIVSLPFAREDKVEQQLLHLMLGVSKVLDQVGIPLIGGHTAEGVELSLGLAVNGLICPGRLLTKAGLQPGDVLLLTKPLGSGVLLAADMRAQAKGSWVKSAIENMRVSNQPASEALLNYPIKACTDVTGFGLAGHLIEMLQASECRARLKLSSVPVLDGALALMGQGYFSTLHEQNKQIEHKMLSYIELETSNSSQCAKEILFDPQTAGGLLFGVSKVVYQAVITELRTLGYSNVSMIGEIID